MITNTDTVIEERKVYQTSDYNKFKFMAGNRIISDSDVKAMARVMQAEGNLTNLFPVEVNENFYVIDGQRRLKACRLNNSPVCYVILEGGNVDTVIVRNTNMHNWNWLDFAQSWAARGNKDYIEFLRMWEEYRLNYGILLRYCGIHSEGAHGIGDTTIHKFHTGNIQIKDLELTRKLLRQYAQLVDESGVDRLPREFAYALYGVMRTSSYHHDIMVGKIRKYGDGLSRCYTATDFQIELENIYKA